jgi:PST family polysaccharide transporter
MNKRHFAIGAAWTAGAAWLEQLGNFVIFVIIARMIGTEPFGIAAMSLAFVLFGEVLVRETITEGIIERRNLDDGFLEATFAALVGFGLIIFVALCAFAPVAAMIYAQPSVAYLMLATSPTVLLIAVSGVPTALLRRKMAFQSLAYRSTAGVIVGGVIGIYMATEGYGAWSLVFQRLSMMVINCVFTIIAAGWWPKRLPKRADFGMIGGLGPQVVVLRATTLIITQTPAVTLGIAIGPNAVAIYSLAWRLVEVIVTVTVSAPRSVAQSTIAAVRRNNEGTTKLFLELCEFVALIGIAALAGLALIADPAIKLIFGPQWQMTAVVLPWVCLAGAIAALTELQESYLMAINQSRRYVRMVVFEAVAGIVLLGVASAFGVVAAAAVFGLRAVLFLPIRTAAALAPERISAWHYARSLGAPIVAAAGMSAAVGLWRVLALGHMADIIYLFAAVLIGVASFSAILALVTPGVLVRLKSFID